MAFIETVSLYCLIYIIPGCIFYLIFAFHLFTKNNLELKSPFFGILRVLAIVDLLTILFSDICLRTGYLLSQIPYFQPPGKYNVVATILAFGTMWFCSVQAFLHVAMAFNRLTAILIPHNYSNLWNGKYFYGIIFVAFLIPGLMFSWMLYFGGQVSLSPIFSTYVVDVLRTTGVPWLKKPIFSIVIISSTCIVAFVFDIITFVLLKKAHLVKNNASKYKQELRLLTVSIAFLIVHTLILVPAVYTFAFPMQNGQVALIILQVTTEIQSLISPFCVLFVDRKFRRDFFHQSSKPTAIASHFTATRPSFKP